MRSWIKEKPWKYQEGRDMTRTFCEPRPCLIAISLGKKIMQHSWTEHGAWHTVGAQPSLLTMMSQEGRERL